MSLLLTQLVVGPTAHTRSASDTITLSDVASKRAGLAKADTLTLTDAITSKRAGLAESDTLTLSDAITSKAVGLFKSDTISFADLLTTAEQNVLSLSDTINLSDLQTSAWVIIRTASDTITLSDSESHVSGTGHTRSASDTISLSDLATPLHVVVELVSLADIITLTDSATVSHTVGTEEFPTQFPGLRVFINGEVVELCMVAVEDAPSGTGGVLKIRINDTTTYALYLVDVDDENASQVRVRTSNGTWAIRKLTL